jgi:flagellar protein FliS
MRLAQLANSYKTTAVATSSPGQLVLMLFDGTLRYIGAARKAASEESFPRRNERMHNNLVKAQTILRELQCSLDLAAGGEFAERMFQLYEFMNYNLQQANLKKSPEPIDIVEKLLLQIRDAWAEMLQKNVEAAA